MRYSAKPITRTISALIGTHLPLGGEKQLKFSVLLKDTSVTTGIQTHTLLNKNTRAGVRCSYTLCHDTHYHGVEQKLEIICNWSSSIAVFNFRAITVIESLICVKSAIDLFAQTIIFNVVLWLLAQVKRHTWDSLRIFLDFRTSTKSKDYYFFL